MSRVDEVPELAQRLSALRATGLLDAPPSASFDRLTRLATELLDVPVALVSLVDADRQFFASCIGLPAEVSAQRETPLSHSFCAHVVETAEPLVVTDAREDQRVAGNLAIRDLDVIAYLGVPISHPDGAVIGSFCAIDHRPRPWTVREVALMRDLAASVDTEIALHVAVQAERGARERAEEAGAHLRLLAEASAAFAESLDVRTTVRTLTRLAVPALADWCTVDLLEAGHVRRLALADRDDEPEARRQLARFPPRLDAEAGVGAVMRTGRPTIVQRIDEDWLRRVTHDEEHRETVRRLGAASAALVPLVARGRTLGALSFVSRTPDRYDDGVVPLLLEMGQRTALALDNATLYSSARTIARTLQQSLLPPRLPDVPGTDLGRHYLPAGSGAEVGGDFYDVFEVPDGRWLAVVGDVVGKGPEAAAVTGLARHTLRAAAMREVAPSRILRTLNDVLLAEQGDGDGTRTIFATVAAVALRVEDGRAVCTVSSGGHPPPLIRRADGSVEQVDVPGTVLGVVEDCVLGDGTVLLEPGDVMLLYTDGVTEARAADGTFLGESGLHALLAEADATNAAAVVAGIGAEVDALQGGSARDDIAMLALRVPPRRHP